MENNENKLGGGGANREIHFNFPSLGSLTLQSTMGRKGAGITLLPSGLSD